MRLSAKQYLGALAILFLAIPIWARPDSTRTYTANWSASQVTTIGHTQIKPGDYQLEAHENQNTLDIMRNGKVVAQVPCHWTQLPMKAPNTEVDLNNNQIVRVEFAGNTEAVQVQ